MKKWLLNFVPNSNTDWYNYAKCKKKRGKYSLYRAFYNQLATNFESLLHMVFHISLYGLNCRIGLLVYLNVKVMAYFSFTQISNI